MLSSSRPDHSAIVTDATAMSLLPSSAPSPPPPQQSVLVTEGLPPLSACLLEQIPKWEFIDLTILLDLRDQDSFSQVL